MRLPALLVTDLHLTANPVDEYRWPLFEWLTKQCARFGVQTLVILGDLTDAKDYHSAELVNRVVAGINTLRRHVPKVIVMPGNHDYLREGHCFFSFLSALPGVVYADRPLDTSAEGEPCLFLPHVKKPAQAWAGLDFSHYRYLFMHQTVKGAKSSNGQEMDGEQMPDLTAAGKVWSGDIHVPQKIGPVEYVGSPYPVHCGDNFKARCVLIDGANQTHDLYFRTISRWSLVVADPGELFTVGARPGDHAKVVVELARSELHLWRDCREQVKAWAKESGVELLDLEMRAPRARARVRVGVQSSAGVSPEEVVERFVRRHELGGDALDIGLRGLA